VIWGLQRWILHFCWGSTNGAKRQSSRGVAFTIDPDTGFQNTIIINSSWGLGENIVKGTVTPDEWMVFKPTLQNKNLNPILKKHCGRKKEFMVYGTIKRNFKETPP
jgi:phosphoenolpyruvate synthase/pyruvate phosphate dikinase